MLPQLCAQRVLALLRHEAREAHDAICCEPGAVFGKARPSLFIISIMRAMVERVWRIDLYTSGKFNVPTVLR